MSGPRHAAEPPLLTHAVPGFRAWSLDSSGQLGAAAWDVHWTPGVNVAACARGGGHDVPAAQCTCGLYAFHTVHRQLASAPVIGAVAAWGAMEVHADGFRAERARVLALARRDRMGTAELAALRRAAERYGVPIVARSALEAVVALRTAAPSAAVLGLAGSAAARWEAQHRGWVPEDQLWLEAADGVVTLGVTAAVRQLLGPEVRVGLRAGDRLEGSADLPVDGDAVQLDIPVPVAGTVVAVNDQLRGGHRQSDGAAWLARIVPSSWQQDAAHVQWGGAGYAAARATAANEGARVVDHLRRDVRRDPAPLRSWRDVQQALRAARPPAGASPFGSAEALYDDLAVPLGLALERDAAARDRLGRLGIVLALQLSEPSARVTLDLRAGRGSLACGRSALVPDVEVACRAQDALALLEGRLDLGRESRTGRLQVTGSPAAALSALAVLTAWSRRVLDHGEAVATPSPARRRRTA